MPPEHTIYAIYDPLDASEARYIGQTSRTIELRLSDHLREAESNPIRLYRWIRRLLAAGRTPAICAIEKCPANAWKLREQFYIAKARSCGMRLMNLTNGGTDRYVPRPKEPWDI